MTKQIRTWTQRINPGSALASRIASLSPDMRPWVAK
jgi:hypothetical protein